MYNSVLVEGLAPIRGIEQFLSEWKLDTAVVNLHWKVDKVQLMNRLGEQLTQESKKTTLTLHPIFACLNKKLRRQII